MSLRATKIVNLPVLASAIAIASLASSAPAKAASCQIIGSFAPFGQNMSGEFNVRSGSSCRSTLSMPGTMQNTKVVTPAQHGTVRMVSLTTFEYKAKPGFTGSDSFVLAATGVGTLGTGTSTLNMKVNVK
jgi:Bacterial Ig domain